MTVAAERVVEHAATFRPHAVLVLVMVATALSNLEVGLVNVALPTLAATFRAGPTTIQWVAISYQLAIVGTLILFGRLVDLLGGRALYLAGMATFVVASLLALLSQHVLWLIVARGLLGLGASMLLATGQALLAVAYPTRRHGRALGFMHMAVAAGLMAGPSIGGLLVTTLGWRAIFLAPLALAIGAFAFAWKVLPRLQTHRGERLDLPGAVLVFVATTLAVLGLTRLAQAGWHPATGLLLVLALLAGGLFVRVERRQSAPLVDLHLLERWRLAAGLLAAWLTFIALASNMFLIPFALQNLMAYSAAGAGIVMLAVPVAILPVAPLAGALADRFGSRLPTVTGLVAIVAAIVGMAQFQATTPRWFAVAMLALYGVGAGLFQAPNNSAVLASAPARRTGTISGMLALARNLGQVTGIVVASTVWTWRQHYYERLTHLPQRALAASLHDAFLVLAGFGLLALIVTALRPQAKGATNDA